MLEFINASFDSYTEGVPISEWPEYQLVSLLDMIKFKAPDFFRLTQTLIEIRTMIEGHERRGTPDEVISDDNTSFLESQFDKLLSLCQEMGLILSVMLIKEVKVAVHNRSNYTILKFAREMKEVERRILHEMSLPLFMVMSRDKAEYYEKIDLFGSQVSANFPATVYDIEESGNCYATGRYTASVFHLMRVLEKGLHAFARELKITFPTPLELENWQNIIEKIESEIKELNKLPKGQQKSDELQFYSEAAKEFRYFKDAWRNHVAHSRERYDERQAKRILEHVRDFMEHIAARIKE